MAWLTGWTYRKEIRYGTVFPGGNLTDFPKLFSIVADADIAAALSGGGGIAITLPDGDTEIPLGTYPETVLASGTILMRVLLSLLTAASTGDVMGCIYYDAAESTTEDKAGVVSNGYVLFADLEQDPSGSPPQMFDWVTETNIGTSGGSMTSGDLVAAQVGNGLDFDGSNDRIDCGIFDLRNAITISAWVFSSGRSGFDTIVSNYDIAGGVAQYDYAINNGGKLVFQVSNVAGYKLWTDDAELDTDVWKYTVITHNGSMGNSDVIIYVDGGVVNITPSLFGTPTMPTAGFGNTDIGRAGDFNGNYFSGKIDEVRISSVVRSADWIAYEYEDEANNSDTFTLGDEETEGGVSATINQAFELDLAQPLNRIKVKSLGLDSELDLAQPINRIKQFLSGQTSELDLAQPFTRVKTKGLGQSSELDLAQSLNRLKTLALNQTFELDLAQLLTSVKTQGLLQTFELDLAQPVNRGGQNVTLIPSFELDLAQSFSHLKTRTLSQSSELDGANIISTSVVHDLNQVAELDDATSLSSLKSHSLGMSQELDGVGVVTPLKVRGLNQTFELDGVRVLSPVKVGTVNIASELDSAFGITWSPKTRILNTALELDSVPGVFFVVSAAVAPPIIEITLDFDWLKRLALDFDWSKNIDLDF